MLSAVLTLSALLPQAPEPTWQVHTLSNCIQLHVYTSPNAKQQATLTFLPLGLTSDRRGQAQFAHLAEHMMIRRTDPNELQVEGMNLNGETTNSALRLDSLAEPDHWKEALQRHIKWLHTRKVDAKTLAREKIRIEGEERNTVQWGNNHKWASVAWTQFMAGSQHAAVHGDVEGASVEAVEAYLKRVKVSEAKIFAAGPRELKEQVDLLESAIAAEAGDRKATAREASEEKPEVDGNLLPPKHLAFTWDLDAAHYLEWYALPKECSRLEAQVIALPMIGLCYGNAKLRQLPGLAQVSAVHYSGRNYLLFSANQPGDVEVDELQKAFAVILRSSRSLVRLQMNGKMLFQQTFDIRGLQRQAAANPQLQLSVEPQYAIGVGYACMRSGLDFEALQPAYTDLDSRRLATYIEQSCSKEQRSSCTVTKH